jgi:pyruvate ferredoxin oxidoreductase alpha subunit
LVPGGGGVMAADVRAALGDGGVPVHAVIAGLGGRAVTRASLGRMLDGAASLGPLTMLDLDPKALARAGEEA